MKKQIMKLLTIFHKRKVVEKIANSNGNMEVYEKEKDILAKRLEIFAEEAKKRIEDSGYAIRNSDKYEIKPYDAVQICFICIMTGIAEGDLLQNYEELNLALRKVKGQLKPIATKIANIEENTFLSLYDEEALFKQIF